MLSVNKILPAKINSGSVYNAAEYLQKSAAPPQKDYKLLIRQDNLPVFDVKATADIPAPYEADSFNYVKIGKKSDDLFYKEVISFFDKSKKLIMRIFKQNEIDTKIRYYNNGSENDRLISTFKYAPNHSAAPDEREIAGHFELVCREYQKVTELNPHIQANNSGYPKRISSKKTEILYNGDEKTQHITYTRTPFNHGIGKPSDKKVLQGKIVCTHNEFILKDITKTDNVNLDMNDKYLKVRFLDPRSADGIKVLTRQLLEEKKLNKLNISISTNCYFADRTEGEFCPETRNISFKDFSGEKLPDDAVNCAAHEVEHAYQYAQTGRLGKGNTSYATDALKILGGLTDMDEIREAVQYSMAGNIYPRRNKNWKNTLYRDNYLEEKAREAGVTAANEYRNSKNYDFFNEFRALTSPVKL